MIDICYTCSELLMFGTWRFAVANSLWWIACYYFYLWKRTIYLFFLAWVWVCVSVCRCVGVCMSVHLWVLGVILYHCLLTSLRQGLSLNPGFTFSPLAWTLANPSPLLFLSTSELWFQVSIKTVTSLCGGWDPNSRPQGCIDVLLTSEPSLQFPPPASLSLTTFLSLESSLSGVSMDILVFWSMHIVLNFFCPFTFDHFVPLLLWCASGKQHRIGLKISHVKSFVFRVEYSYVCQFVLRLVWGNTVWDLSYQSVVAVTPTTPWRKRGPWKTTSSIRSHWRQRALTHRCF